MAYYNRCDTCGAHLDPGEHCDCKEVKQVRHYECEIEDLIIEIIKQNPRLSASGVSNKLHTLYNLKLNNETVRKITNRLIQFDGLRADRSSSGSIVYFYAKEA